MRRLPVVCAVVTAVAAGQSPAVRAQQQRPDAASRLAEPSAAPVADGEGTARSDAEAAVALRAAQELEARLIEIRRELDALARRQAAWEDMRRRLDEVDVRLQELSRSLAAGAPAEAAASPVRFRRDQGLIIRSSDNAFLLRPVLRLQPRYEGIAASRGPGDPPVLNDPDRSGFLVSHAEVIFEGHANGPKLEFRLQVDFAEPRLLKDAFVQYRLARSVAIRMGQFKIPYSLQRQYWTAQLELVDLTLPMEAFSLGRDVGIMVVGRPLAGRLQYQLAVLNGAGQGQLNDNFDLAYAARIVAAPFGPLPRTEGDIEGHARPLLQVGLSGVFNLVPTDIAVRTGNPTALLDMDNDGRIDNVAVWQGGAELRAIWRGASLQAEYFGRREHPGGSSADRTYWGGYVQASYFVLPHHLALVARLGRTDLPLYGVSLDERQRRGTTVDEQGGGVSAYLHGHRAKAQVDYSHLVAEDASSAPRAHRVRAAVQLVF